QPVNTVGGQAFTDGFNNRDTTGDGGFVHHAHAFGFGGGENFFAVHGNQRFVGGNHMLTVGNCAQHPVFGDGVTTNQLHHDVDVGVIDNVVYVGGNGHVTGVDRGVRMTGSHLSHNNVATRPACDLLSVTGEHTKVAATHCTSTTDTYFPRCQGRPTS